MSLQDRIVHSITQQQRVEQDNNNSLDLPS